MIIFWGIPQFFWGVLWIFVLLQDDPGKKRQFHKLSPHFHGVSTLVENVFKNHHDFWRVNPPTIPPSCSLAPLTCQQVTDKSGDPCDLVRIMKGTGHISSNCGSNRSFRFFFSGFGRFPLVPELGDNYPKSGSFFLNTWTLSWICFVFNLMVLKALKTRLDPPVHQWWMILFRL